MAIALPSIGDDLGFSRSGLQWVISAYVLAFGGFLLPAGRAADLWGRRRVFVVGLALFSVASLVCGLSGDRKSTRLNSSHANISYAVFCLKKKKISLPSLPLLRRRLPCRLSARYPALQRTLRTAETRARSASPRQADAAPPRSQSPRRAPL